jgi:hypothetical protein
MYRLVVAVAFAGALSITASGDGVAAGGHGGHGGGHMGGGHFGGSFGGRFHGGGPRAGSFGGMHGGRASGFRQFSHSLDGAHNLNRHIDHFRRFNNKILIFEGNGYDNNYNNCYPVWNGAAYVSSCGMLYDYW